MKDAMGKVPEFYEILIGDDGSQLNTVKNTDL